MKTAGHTLADIRRNLQADGHVRLDSTASQSVAECDFFEQLSVDPASVQDRAIYVLGGLSDVAESAVTRASDTVWLSEQGDRIRTAQLRLGAACRSAFARGFLNEPDKSYMAELGQKFTAECIATRALLALGPNSANKNDPSLHLCPREVAEYIFFAEAHGCTRTDLIRAISTYKSRKRLIGQALKRCR